MLEYHIAKKADITVVCKDMPADEDVTSFGMVKMNEDRRIAEFEEKPMVATIQYDFLRYLCDPQTSAD